MAFLRGLVGHLRSHHLLITNTFASGILLATGDLAIQQLERTSKDQPRVNWKRTGMFFVTGFCAGPILHGWYSMLDRRFPVVNMISVAKKVLLDQTFAGPFFITYFFLVTGFLEGKSRKESFRELQSKFFAVYLVDWAIWPVAQSLNFYFVPPRFRVVYVGVITLAYNAFLSFIKHSEGKGKQYINFVDNLFSSEHCTKKSLKSEDAFVVTR